MTKKSPPRDNQFIARFKYLLANAKFINAILDLRRQYKIPKTGFLDHSELLSWLTKYDDWTYTDELKKIREEKCNGFPNHYTDLFEYYFLYNQIDDYYSPIKKATFRISKKHENGIDVDELSIAFDIDATETDILNAFEAYKKSYLPLVSELRKNQNYIATGTYSNLDMNIRATQLYEEKKNIYDVLDTINDEFPEANYDDSERKKLQNMINRTRKIIDGLMK